MLAAAMALAGVLLLYWGRDQTFFADDWVYIIYYRDWDPETLLYPANGHLVVLPLLLFKTVLAAVGADSFAPFRVMALAFVLVNAMLLYLLARRRLGPELALAPAVLMLFLGSAWEVIGASFSLTVLTSTAAGLGMLLCLDRGDMRGDAGACVLLALSLASFSLGVVFALIAAAEILQRDGGERLRRSWVVLGPVALYAVWFLWALKYDQSTLDAANIGAAPAAVADAAAAVSAAIFGVFRTPGAEVPGSPDLSISLDWGTPIALVLAALLVLRLRYGPRPSPRAWALLGALVLYWALLALSISEARAPNSSRYLYAGTLLVLLLAIELAAGMRIGRGWRLAVAAVLAVSLVANVDTIRVAGGFFREEAEYNRSQLAALELVRDEAPPDLPVEEQTGSLLPHGDLYFGAFQYFDAIDEFGSPAYSAAELAEAGPPQRAAADRLLGRALRLRAEPVRSPPAPERAARGSEGTVVAVGPARHMEVSRRQGCVVLRPDLGREGLAALRLPPGGFAYRAGPRAEVDLRLGRFGDGFAVEPAQVLGSAVVRIPRDDSSRPWRALLAAADPFEACPL
ncbi:MAG: hypothetical protein AABM29_04620 [Actinomycetota bacterium]